MMNILLLLFVVWIVGFISFNGHIIRADYKWRHGGLYYKFFAKTYYRIEYAIMKMLYNLGTGWLMQHFKFLRKFLVALISINADGEVYTLDECYKILDSLYKDLPNVYVGMRICACRQSNNNYSKDISNITDLLFIFSKIPNEKLKKPLVYTKYITLDHAKRLLKKFDREGFVHTMFGGCARWMDGSASLSICNCRRDTCVPMKLAVDYDSFLYHKPHNLAIIDSDKCTGADECGKCLEYCQFDARIVDKDTQKIKILNDKCMGCGLCLSHCPEGANKIKFLPKNKVWFYQNLFKNIKKQHKQLPPEKHPIRHPDELKYATTH
ncbi:MAG: ATP-binding protein [Promethearchaeota archaeon]